MSVTRSNSSTRTKVCCFCNLEEDNELDYGKFYEHNGIVTHYYCLLLSSNMEQKGNDDEGILGFLAVDIQKELRRGKRLVCSYCKKIGATLGCCNVKCKRIFHFPCGQKAGSLHQFFGEFRSYCINHRPRQNIDDYILKQANSSNDVLCYICYDKVNHSDPVDTLWAPCCKNAWFHRKCVQQLALSAGYFFKCPLCNNKKEFQEAMLEYGIFIPSQDASWELVPNAFEELLFRHDRCDAVICLCPKGRKHTSSNAKWELALCRTCGSQGIHMACGQLKWANPSWECSDCTSILRKCHGNTASSSSSDSSSQSRDSSDDSDTDISVGTDSPISYLPSSHGSSFVPVESNIKLRPGPRSFKLQQQMKTNGTIQCTSQFTHTTSERNNTNKTDPDDVVELISKNDNLKKEPKTSKEDNLKQENNEKENSPQQASKIDNSVEKRKSSSNTEKPVLNEADVIVIDSDEDDIEIISLGQKKDLSSVQTAPTNILSSNSVNVTGSSLASVHESTSTNKILINPSKIDSTNSQKSNALKSEILNKKESNALEESTTLMPQMLMHDTNFSKKDNVLEDANVLDASVSSVMNIKITNVTSLPPEIFASVPEVGREEKTARVPDVNTVTNKSLEKWFATHIPPTKSDVREDSNSKRKLEFIRLPLNEVADNCKKLKGDSYIKTCSTDKTQSTDSRDNIVHNTSQKQDQIISETGFNNIRGDTKDFSKSMVSRNEISRLPIINNQNNELLIKSKADLDHVSTKSNHLEENNASVIVQHCNKSFSQLMNTSVIHPNQFYVKIPPPNIFFTEPTLNSNTKNSQCTRNTGNVAYATASSDTALPQVMSTAMIDNRRTIFPNQPIATNVIRPINANNNEIGMLNKQEIGFTNEASSKNVSISGNESSNKICDGDAGRTSPAVTRRSTCFSEIIGNTRTSEVLETNSTDRKSDQSSKSHAKVRRSLRRKISGENDTMYISSAPYSPSTKKHDVFPQVTNNHNACHQPRLIPQYMHLQDLKFRVCGSDSVQMILYDMFSVNMPVKNATQKQRSRLGVVSREAREPAISCRAQNETLSSLDPADSTTNCLNNSKTKCIADSAVVTAVHSNDDTKENLDPVTRTVSRMLGNNISVANSIEDAAANDYVCGEHGSHMRLISSDINLSLLKRTIRNTNIDSVENCIELIPNNRINQTLRFNLEDTQHKQSTCGISAAIEDRIGAQLFCNETVRSIDFNLNVVNTNKNVEKALLDDITVSTNRHVNDKEINSDHTDDSSIVGLKNSSITSNNSRSNNNYMYLDSVDDTGLKIRDWNVARVPSITFNERSISNKQINAYDSKQLLRCTVFHENTVNPKIGNNPKYEINPCFKVSIDLRKIQNLIDSKPELFVNPEYIDDRRRRYTSSLSDEDYYAQEEQVKYYDIEKSDSAKRSSSFKNGQLQLSDYVSEEIQVQDPSSSANILE